MLAAATSQAAALDNHEQVILAIIAVLATCVAGLVYVVKAYGQAKQTNAAVNHRDTGELSLYRLADSNSRKLDDVIAKQAEFDRKWGNLPAEIGDAVGLNETLHDMNRRLDDIQTQLVDHVAWETEVKWPAITKGEA